ncbi:MAG: T9SS type A sorting domain-containing protein [bacterium]|nr:T9SS type A sorting domain-containing protein [bacterium]
MYKTTDGGNNWEFLSDIFDLTVLQFAFESNSKGYMLAVDYNYQDLYTIYQTLDGGLNWVPLRKYTYLKNIFVSETGKIWGVGEYAQIFSSDEIITSVEEDQIKEEINTYLLSQNFPNPFNPITTIRYSIANHSNVTIKVYDILGREVVALVNEEKPVGEYEVEFNAETLPSGIYFYQLKAGQFSETKKMILLK